MNRIPVGKKKNESVKFIHVALALIVKDGRILICKRPAKTHLGGYWEFPGGKKKNNETWPRCLCREVDEELGIALHQIKFMTSFNFDYRDRAISFRVFQCRVAAGTVQPIVSQEVKWVSPDALKRYRFPPANRDLIRQLGDALFQSK